MGLFSRFTEQTRQSMRFVPNKKDWRVTSNERNNAMIKDARAFAESLKRLQAEIQAIEKALNGGLHTYVVVLKSKLPKIYDNAPPGAVTDVLPTDPSEQPIGVGVNTESIDAAVKTMSSRLNDEVLKPLDDWLKAYRAIKERNVKAEALRLDVDAQRRSVQAALEKYEKAKSKAEGNPKKEKETEDLLVKYQNEDNKEKHARDRFNTIEAEINQSLHALIRDTGVLREYAAASLNIFQTTFQTSYVAFDLSVAPVPPPTTLDYGTSSAQTETKIAAVSNVVASPPIQQSPSRPYDEPPAENPYEHY